MSPTQPPRRWTIWRRLGFYSVLGPETTGSVEVIEAEPTVSLIRQAASVFTERGISDGDFYGPLKKLFEMHKENK